MSEKCQQPPGPIICMESGSTLAGFYFTLLNNNRNTHLLEIPVFFRDFVIFPLGIGVCYAFRLWDGEGCVIWSYYRPRDLFFLQHLVIQIINNFENRYCYIEM